MDRLEENLAFERALEACRLYTTDRPEWAAAKQIKLAALTIQLLKNFNRQKEQTVCQTPSQENPSSIFDPILDKKEASLKPTTSTPPITQKPLNCFTPGAPSVELQQSLGKIIGLLEATLESIPIFTSCSSDHLERVKELALTYYKLCSLIVDIQHLPRINLQKKSS